MRKPLDYRGQDGDPIHAADVVAVTIAGLAVLATVVGLIYFFFVD